MVEDNMAEQSNSPENKTQNKPSPETEELGLLESYGSFPVWMLKLIHFMTPAFLIQKPPPEKKSPRN